MSVAPALSWRAIIDRARAIRWALLALALAATPLVAQRSTPATAPGEIHGRLLARDTGHPVPGGSVAVRRSGDSSFAGGAFAKPDGTFRVDGLPLGRYEVRVRAIGVAPVVRGGLLLTVAHPTLDVGDLRLAPVAAQLGAIQTVATAGDVTLAPDRTTYAAKAMTVASGGSALDLLRHLPLVDVDAGNTVSLRGNAHVVVQVDGRAIPLQGDQLGAFLAQLPSARVRQVEVATNPSVKEDPDGTAGIINLVLDTSATASVSGTLSATTASTGQTGLSGTVAEQRGRGLLFWSWNVLRDPRPVHVSITRTDLLPVAPTMPAVSDAIATGRTTPMSAGTTVRGEYHLSDRTALVVDGWLFSRHLVERDVTRYTDLAATNTVLGIEDERTAEVMQATSLDLDVAVRHAVPATGRTISVDLEMANSASRRTDDLTVDAVQSSGRSAIAPTQNRTTGGLPFLALKSDASAQMTAGTKLDVGVKLSHRATTLAFDTWPLDSAGVAGTDALGPTSGYTYQETIASGYALFSGRAGPVQSQTGVRLEDAVTRLTLPGQPTAIDRRAASLYPSAALVWTLSPARTARLSYARRTTRPTPYQLSPLVQRADARNVALGNPTLRAEYTDAVEGLVQDTHAWGTLQLSPYVRHAAHAIRFVQYVDSSGVAVGTYGNVGTVWTAGADAAVSTRRGPVQMGAGGSVYRYTSTAPQLVALGLPPAVHATVWSTRTNATWVITPRVDVQWVGSYRAPVATESGSQPAAVQMTLAGRYKAWGDLGSVSIRIVDPCNLQRAGYRSLSGHVLQVLNQHVATRGIYLSISRTFGRTIKVPARAPDADALPPGA